MDPEIVIPAVIAALAALAAGALGYVLGRRAGREPDLARIEELGNELEAARIRAEERERELEGELDDARRRADGAQAGVDAHFEASAGLLGQLARDYRALFEHWADGANRLGGSAARTEAIIEQAREQLLIGGSGEGTRESRAEAPAAAEPLAEADTAAAEEEPDPVTGTAGPDAPPREPVR